MLGGHNIQAEPEWRRMLQQFWATFSMSSPGVALQGIDPEVAIPIAIHGDEGRGRAKRPIMVISIQPLVSWLGSLVLNSSGSFGFAHGMCFLVCIDHGTI